METNAHVEGGRTTSNPLFLITSGVAVTPTLPDHRQGGRVGNLWYEYAQGAKSLRGIVRSGEQIAEFLQALDLIVWHQEAGTYEWKDVPMTRAGFLRMIDTMQTTARREAGTSA